MSVKDEYIQYCKLHEPCIFLHPSWFSMQDENWQVLKSSSSDLVLYFVYIYEKKLGFRFIRNSFLTPYGGFHGDYLYMNPETLNLCVYNILNQLPKFDIFNMDLHPDIKKLDKPFDFEISARRTNILTLTSIEENYKNCKPALQRQIKKAKRNLQIEESIQIQCLINLYEKTLTKRKEKNPIPISVFHKVWNHCQKNNCGTLFIIKDKNESIHASLLLVFDKTTAYYLCGGTDESFYGSGAMSGLMWHAISYSIGLGLRFFDFEGSMIEGVNRFFQNFSPTEIPYYKLQKTNSTIFKLFNKK